MPYGCIADALVFAEKGTGTGGQEAMPDREEEIRYLRQKARQFRELASAYPTEISPKLCEIAEELEARATALEDGED